MRIHFVYKSRFRGALDTKKRDYVHIINLDRHAQTEKVESNGLFSILISFKTINFLIEHEYNYAKPLKAI